MSDELRAAHFISIILSEIRRNHLRDDEAFSQIIGNDVVIPELTKNYGYYHMFGYDRVIEELSSKEPLLKR
jgi:hypothetical protein